MNRDELKLHDEWLTAQEAYVKAKTKRKRGQPDPPELVAAKKKVDEMRSYWRRVGEAAGTRQAIAPIGRRN